MPYIAPAEVISPKTVWRLVDVVLDEGEGEPAYAIGMWNKKRAIGFRWNGTNDSPLGNPQSRGLPTWTILDSKLNRAVVRLVRRHNPEKLGIIQAFLGLTVDDDQITA